jgi:hypothetical protein
MSRLRPANQYTLIIKVAVSAARKVTERNKDWAW